MYIHIEQSTWALYQRGLPCHDFRVYVYAMPRALLLAAGALVLGLHVQDAISVDLEAPGLLARGFFYPKLKWKLIEGPI